jgi:hypothetical protein
VLRFCDSSAADGTGFCSGCYRAGAPTGPIWRSCAVSRAGCFPDDAT